MNISRRDSFKMLGGAAALATLPISLNSLSAEQLNTLDTNGYVAIDRASANQFEGLTVAFNQRWKASNCQIIYFCVTSEGAKNVLQLVVDNVNYRDNFSVKSGGHCYEDFVFNDNITAIIDTSCLKAGGALSDGTFYAEAGLTNWEAAKMFYKQLGKCVPGGTCYSVGLGGHIVGGGFGVLSRLHGLTVDQLEAIEVATVDASNIVTLHECRHDDADTQKQDLFWAHCGGGGGNFGIITKYIFKSTLPDAPNYSDITRLAVSWDNIPDAATFKSIVRLYELSIKTWPNELYCAANFNHQHNGNIDFDIVSSFDDVDIGDALYISYIRTFFDDLVALGVSPFSLNGPGDGVQRLGYLDAVEVRGAIVGGTRNKFKSCHMRADFPEDHLDTFYTYLTTSIIDSNSKSVDFYANVQMHTYGGAINDIASNATPDAARDSFIKIQYIINWKQMLNGSEGWDAACLNWMKDLYSATYANYPNNEPVPGFPDPQTGTVVVDGCYVGYCDKDLIDWPTLYYGGNYARLQYVKNDWDPQNLFNHAQSIVGAPRS
ncbi:BBE domain-containing protein [Vibrio sp. BS-M-Sm-2]|uniref:BBE domain-containing protein n=1 Tax=Vibrio sp. BS-M-Sm-2 TaxID=3241167 RepID=UPI003557D73E